MQQTPVALPQLRPMSLGDMFDAAFRLYRRYFLTFIGIAALLQVPIAIAQMAVQLLVGGNLLTSWMRVVSSPGSAGSNPFENLPIGQIIAFFGLTFGLAVVQVLLGQSLMTGALANAVARAYTGQSVSILQAYRIGWQRFFALVGAALATFLVGAVVLAVLGVCTFGVGFALLRSGNENAGILAGVLVAVAAFGLLALLILASMFFYTRLLLSTQAIVLEGQGPLAGLGRSWQLTKGAFWRALAITVLMSILAYIIAGIPASAVSFALQLLSAGDLTAIMRNQAIVSGITVLGQIIVIPLQLVIYTLLYYDLRMRKEGYDLELMARQQAPAL